MRRVNGVILKGKGRWYTAVLDEQGGGHPCFNCNLGELCRVPPSGVRLVGLCSEILGESTGKFRFMVPGDVPRLPGLQDPAAMAKNKGGERKIRRTDFKLLFARAGGEWHVACGPFSRPGRKCGTCSILMFCKSKTRFLCDEMGFDRFRMIGREDALDALDSAEDLP